MPKIVMHPSSKRSARNVLLEHLENANEYQSVALLIRTEDGSLTVDCCDTFTNEDVAYAIQIMQLWFKEIVESE